MGNRFPLPIAIFLTALCCCCVRSQTYTITRLPKVLTRTSGIDLYSGERNRIDCIVYANSIREKFPDEYGGLLTVYHIEIDSSLVRRVVPVTDTSQYFGEEFSASFTTYDASLSRSATVEPDVSWS